MWKVELAGQLGWGVGHPFNSLITVGKNLFLNLVVRAFKLLYPEGRGKKQEWLGWNYSLCWLVSWGSVKCRWGIVCIMHWAASTALWNFLQFWAEEFKPICDTFQKDVCLRDSSSKGSNVLYLHCTLNVASCPNVLSRNTIKEKIHLTPGHRKYWQIFAWRNRVLSRKLWSWKGLRRAAEGPVDVVITNRDNKQSRIGVRTSQSIVRLEITVKEKWLGHWGWECAGGSGHCEIWIQGWEF